MSGIIVSLSLKINIQGMEQVCWWFIGLIPGKGQ